MRILLSCLTLGLLAAGTARAQPAVKEWLAIGPPGGDVRALAADPRDPSRVYLGTSDGVLYRSDDGGERWQRLAPGFPLRGRSLDDIVVDPSGHVFVGYWEVSGNGGGVARSDDDGVTFQILPEIDGQPVRALALAPSDPRLLVVGTPGGAFRSGDAGRSWERISPREHPELRNLNSLAIDPLDPATLYVGTWHLAWKTTDGGGHWGHISTGMIEDSDVMTLTLDRRSPRAIFATACSGIYRSSDAAQRWAKLPGIPASSRRTRAFAQSPDDPATFFAGTTQGLFVSRDDARTWRPASSTELVVNAVLALPGGRVLVGSDGAGVLRSQDHGASFVASNRGFSEHFVSSLALDPQSGRLFAGVLGDRVHAGVFAAPEGASGPWTWLGAGLEGREVLALALAGPVLLAGTDAGLFALGPTSSVWRPVATTPPGTGSPRVSALAVLPGAILAGTPQGMLRSADGGRSWNRIGFNLTSVVTGLAARAPALVMVATPLGLFESHDAGVSFRQVSAALSGIDFRELLLGPGDLLFARGRSGLLRSTDLGRSFRFSDVGLPRSDIAGLALSPDGSSVYASDFASGGVFRSDDLGASWRPLSGAGLASTRVWALLVEARGGRLLAAAASGGLHALTPGLP